MAIKNKKHQEILRLYSARRTVQEWEDFFEKQYSKQEIYQFCRYRKIPLKCAQGGASAETKIRMFEEGFFKEWNQDSSYVLGILIASGCIYRDSFIDLSLPADNYQLLEEIAEKMGLEKIILVRNDNGFCRFNFSCDKMYQDIVSLGMNECKANEVTFPEVPRKFLSDFIRGYFDGCGYFEESRDGRVNTCISAPNKSFLLKLLATLKEDAHIQRGSFDPHTITLRFDYRDALRIRDFLYQNEGELRLKSHKEWFETIEKRFC